MRRAGGRFGAGMTMVLGALLVFGASSATSQPATGSGYAAPAAQLQPAAAGEQIFYIATVHIDGKANVNGDVSHPPESFPDTAASSGGGFSIKRPDPQGNWSVRAFVFQPSQLVVRQGDRVVLNFMGVHGPAHTIQIDGQSERITLRRGEIKTVQFVAGQAGVIRFVSVGREPTMQGSVLVLPSK